MWQTYQPNRSRSGRSATASPSAEVAVRQRRDKSSRGVHVWRRSSEPAQPRLQILLEELEEATLIVAGRVEHQVVQAPVHVVLDLRDGLVGIRRDDPALGDLLDGQRVGGLLHLDRVVD